MTYMHRRFIAKPILTLSLTLSIRAQPVFIVMHYDPREFYGILNAESLTARIASIHARGYDKAQEYCLVADVYAHIAHSHNIEVTFCIYMNSKYLQQQYQCSKYFFQPGCPSGNLSQKPGCAINISGCSTFKLLLSSNQLLIPYLFFQLYVTM